MATTTLAHRGGQERRAKKAREASKRPDFSPRPIADVNRPAADRPRNGVHPARLPDPRLEHVPVLRNGSTCTQGKKHTGRPVSPNFLTMATKRGAQETNKTSRPQDHCIHSFKFAKRASSGALCFSALFFKVGLRASEFDEFRNRREPHAPASASLRAPRPLLTPATRERDLPRCKDPALSAANARPRSTAHSRDPGIVPIVVPVNMPSRASGMPGFPHAGDAKCNTNGRATRLLPPCLPPLCPAVKRYASTAEAST